MEKRNRYAFVYLIIGVAFLFGWQFIQNKIWPPAEKPKLIAPNDAVGLIAGEIASVALNENIPEKIAAVRKEQAPGIVGLLGGGWVPAAIEADIPAQVASERRRQVLAKLPKPELIAMGHGERPYHLQVLLNTQGGSIQQVVATHFQHADREGLPVTEGKDGPPKPLHLLPGVRVKRTEKMRDQREMEVPVLRPGPINLDPDLLEQPSYAMWHYEKAADEQPADTLGSRLWKVVRNEKTAADNTHIVAFETELGAPFFVKITKTFTLSRDEYHIGMSVNIEPHQRPAGASVEKFRYQIEGPHGMPIEGEWYTQSYRQGIVAWSDGSSANRALEMPQDTWTHGGSDRYSTTEKRPIRFAGVMLQYFSSVLAVDNIQSSEQKADYLEHVRFTPTGPDHPGQQFLNDLTFRAISKDLPSDRAHKHPYVLYHGPVKVRLLKQLEGDKAVPEELVNRYRDDLGLRVQTDAPLNNFFGRVANFIGWTDLVVAFTNLIHSLLGLLSQVIPNLALCIMVITIMVRGLLHPFSRRQMINAKVMQAKQEKLAPEVKKLTEKYGDDFSRLNQEKMKLYKEHGINPAAAMGGCVLLLFQMPVFMGLYYALQESIFFRLEQVSTSWIPNLAAPDMLLRWGEGVPFIARPEDVGGFLYLGPYLNILPLIAVALMMYVQNKMMPKSDDPQVQMQMKMMKFMMIFMLIFFYKSAAGLAIYFICSSIWGMIERKLIPKNVAELEAARRAKRERDKSSPSSPTEPTSWLGKKMAGWREKWRNVLEEAQKQQQLSRDQRVGGENERPGQPRNPQRQSPPDGKRKKKKR